MGKKETVTKTYKSKRKAERKKKEKTRRQTNRQRRKGEKGQAKEREKIHNKTNKIPWLLVHKQPIPTERSPFVGEVSTNFVGRGVLRGQHNGSPRPLISGF
jgi:hypothetical protein